MTIDAAQGAGAHPPPPRSDRRRVGPLEVGIVCALVGIGAVIRAHGFTSLDLWFDDAWAASPARVGLSQAVHMVLTAPGYSLALRSWLRLDPTTTWFGQLPAFVLGLAAIPATYVVLRYFRSPSWLAVAGATVIAVGPLTVQYSTRLKEYPFDLLASCLLLVLAEHVRRAPSQRRLGAMAATSVIAFFVSAGCAPVLVGTWGALVIALVGDRRTRLAVAAWLAAALAGCGAVWALFLRGLPTVLSYNWRRRGYLMDYRSLRGAERTVTMIFGGFFHGVTGYPVPHVYFQDIPGPHAPSVAILGAVLLGVAIGVPLVASARARRVAPALPASLTLLVALLLAAADRVPVGDGRTDEVLYPALLVCLAASVQTVSPWVRQHLADGAATRALSWSIATALLAVAVLFGFDHEAQYPTISLRGVAQRLAPLERPGDVVFVDTFNSFGWCYYELTPCRTKIGGVPPWPQGFRPVSTSTAVFIPAHYGIPLPEFTAAQARATRIWYIGYTYGTFDVGIDPALYDLPVATFMRGLLRADGWRPATAGPTTAVLGVHAFALLFVRASAASR